jgi:acyl-CoA dehydrogenase
MDLTPSLKAQALLKKLSTFMDEHIYPNEKPYAEQLHAAKDRFAILPMMDELKDKAKKVGLWNLFCPEAWRLELYRLRTASRTDGSGIVGARGV